MQENSTGKEKTTLYGTTLPLYMSVVNYINVANISTVTHVPTILCCDCLHLR
jgi:hypothetical protein